MEHHYPRQEGSLSVLDRASAVTRLFLAQESSFVETFAKIEIVWPCCLNSARCRYQRLRYPASPRFVRHTLSRVHTTPFSVFAFLVKFAADRPHKSEHSCANRAKVREPGVITLLITFRPVCFAAKLPRRSSLNQVTMVSGCSN